jgi:hypothetical protein
MSAFDVLRTRTPAVRIAQRGTIHFPGADVLDVLRIGDARGPRAVPVQFLLKTGCFFLPPDSM